MDATHLHLILTHFPIIGTIIGLTILAYGKFSKNDSIIKVALVNFVFMALLTVPVFLTGEDAAESVENIVGVSESIIEAHEELAESAIWLMGLLGVLSLVNLFAIYKKATFAKILTLITLIVSIITFGLFAQVGNLGGQIRHSEIRSTDSTIIQDENNGSNNKQDNDGDDD